VWHYHEELELILILKGSGRLFVGDRVIEFKENDIVLIGPDIPHYWLFNISQANVSENTDIDCIVCHFKQDFLGKDFFNLPESQFLRELTSQAKRALHSELPPRNKIRKLLNKVMEQSGILRIVFFLETLLEFANSAPEYLISKDYIIVNHSDDVKRMNTIMEYVRKNFTAPISLDELAQLAQMTKNSFSRYFKQKTGRTPMQLVFDLRIAHACKLLGNPDLPLKEVCYASGFNNPVSFHHAFKKIKAITPHAYRRHILNNS
jgi:AraC-like DNA-binding protein